MACFRVLPGFRVCCFAVGALYVVLAGGILVRGTEASLAPFGVPSSTLASPHYQDAIFWVYSHQLVIGLLLGAFGAWVHDALLQRRLARFLLVAHLYYAFLDFRSSDSPLGNALYQGPASVVPALIGVFVAALFAHLSFCKRLERRP